MHGLSPSLTDLSLVSGGLSLDIISLLPHDTEELCRLVRPLSITIVVAMHFIRVLYMQVVDIARR